MQRYRPGVDIGTFLLKVRPIPTCFGSINSACFLPFSTVATHKAVKATPTRMIFNPLAVILATSLSFPSVRALSVMPSIPNKTTLTSCHPNENAMIESIAEIPFQNSWIQQLSPETPENLAKSLRESLLESRNDNRTKRQVFNGHYVLVKPTELRNPRLILTSPTVAQQLLKLSEPAIQSSDFINYVSGNFSPTDSWATPYALSIMGTRYTNNCPYGTGNAYGDGRAISIGEWNNYELQLKGSGPTPFCRNADGRAVLRSSIREFLASEAMHFLGVRTTRALSLVVSEKDTAQRPWYSEGAKLVIPEEDDARLASYTPEERKTLLAQLRNEKVDPNIMIREPCAITCRVSTSFTRVGHFDLMARRVQKISQIAKIMYSNTDNPKARYDTTTTEWKELEQLVWHACYREFRDEAYTPFIDSKDIASAATILLERSAERLAIMTSEWIRVGFSQGNFNADNCLVGGHTMDYGPFGFMEEYNPLFAKWTGSGNHFGFMNQPSAGFVNYQVLVESVVPVIAAASDEDGGDTTDELIHRFINRAQTLFEAKVDAVFRRKLGFAEDMELADDLWESLRSLMKVTRVDWTLFFRHLTMVAARFPVIESNDDDYEAMLQVLIGEGDSSPFYAPLSPKDRQQYLDWITQWRQLMVNVQDRNVDVAERMRMTNPKYVLREWMLVKAYEDATSQRNYDEIHALFDLIQNPYEEGTPDQQERYYRRTPQEADMAAGTAFMSCSS